MKIKVMKRVMEANEKKADNIRELLKKHNVLMLNFIGSPGAGKTTVLDKTLEKLEKRYRIGIIEGDVATDKDAKRLQKHDIPIVLINTDGYCHLEASGIENAIKEFDLNNTDLIFVENVGNLVCPAEFDIGENGKIAVASIPEGDDKVSKYPMLFNEAEACILNKTDIAAYFNFKTENFKKDLAEINGNIPFLEISCEKGTGLDAWISWIEKRVEKER